MTLLFAVGVGSAACVVAFFRMILIPGFAYTRSGTLVLSLLTVCLLLIVARNGGARRSMKLAPYLLALSALTMLISILSTVLMLIPAGMLW